MGCGGEEQGSCRGVKGSSVTHGRSQLCLLQQLLRPKFGIQILGFFLEEHFSLKYMAKKAGEGSKENCNPKCISALENLEEVEKRNIFALLFTR